MWQTNWVARPASGFGATRALPSRHAQLACSATASPCRTRNRTGPGLAKLRLANGQRHTYRNALCSCASSGPESGSDQKLPPQTKLSALLEQAEELGLDTAGPPLLPELVRRFLDIEPRVWRRGQSLRNRLREHCIFPGMPIPEDVDLSDTLGARDPSAAPAERKFDYNLFLNWLGFRDRDEAVAYMDERRLYRKRVRRFKRRLGFVLMLLAVTGHAGSLLRAASRTPGGYAIALTIGATLDAFLVTGCIMVAIPVVLLAWDFLSAPVARRFDPRRLPGYRASDAVRRLLLMYAFMVWPLLGSAAAIGNACTFVHDPVILTSSWIQGGLTEIGIFWLLVGISARAAAIPALWQWPDLNQEVRIMASGRQNRLVHAFCLWRWLVTASCLWAILLRCSALVRPRTGLVAMQYPCCWGLTLLARHRPLWLGAWLEQGLHQIVLVVAACTIVAYLCYALYYLNFVVPKMPDLDHPKIDDPDDLLSMDPLNRVLAECSPPGARQRFSPIRALLVRLRLIDDDSPEKEYSPFGEGLVERPSNRSALCRLASDPIILDDDDELLRALDALQPNSYVNRLLDAEKRAYEQAGRPIDSLFKPRWEWLQVSEEEARALTKRIRAPPPPPDQRPLVELVESDPFEQATESATLEPSFLDGAGSGIRQRDSPADPESDTESDRDDDGESGPARSDIYHA